jgi:hypothetical protein
VRRLAVLAALFAVIASSFASGHALTETDRDCGPMVLRADHGASHFSASTQAPFQADEHCAVCHWHWAFGHAAPCGVVTIVPHLDAAARAVVSEANRSTSAHAGLRPARAPPAFDPLAI